jgi:hypothetical protein
VKSSIEKLPHTFTLYSVEVGETSTLDFNYALPSVLIWLKGSSTFISSAFKASILIVASL